jgi:hypothetical protein
MADYTANGKEPGGTIATCRATGAGEGADDGVYGTAPGGGFAGNRAVRPCQILLATATAMQSSKILGFQGVDRYSVRHMLISHHHHQLFTAV